MAVGTSSPRFYRQDRLACVELQQCKGLGKDLKVVAEAVDRGVGQDRGVGRGVDRGVGQEVYRVVVKGLEIYQGVDRVAGRGVGQGVDRGVEMDRDGDQVADRGVEMDQDGDQVAVVEVGLEVEPEPGTAAAVVLAAVVAVAAVVVVAVVVDVELVSVLDRARVALTAVAKSLRVHLESDRHFARLGGVLHQR